MDLAQIAGRGGGGFPGKMAFGLSSEGQEGIFWDQRGRWGADSVRGASLCKSPEVGRGKAF